jgi:dTDP-4-amino-4,6-dideoxygalactose transaminase
MIPEVHTPISREDILAACKLLMIDNGKIIESFEKDFAQYIGVPYAKSVPSGRSALYIILKALKLKPGDKVIIPAYTSPIIPLVLLNYGIKPIFADVDIDSLNIKTEGLDKLIDCKTKAIIPVHMFGNPCKIGEIIDIASENDIMVIEDAAQALGAEYQNKKIGKFGDVSLFSFGFGKNITTMGGGMIITKRDDLATSIDSLVSNSRLAIFKNVEMFLKSILYLIGTKREIYNFNSKIWNLVKKRYTFSQKDIKRTYTQFQAALGKILLRKVDELNRMRIRNAKIIMNELQSIKWLSFQKSEIHALPVYLRLIVRLHTSKSVRDKLKRTLLKHGFDVPTLEGYYLGHLNYGLQTEKTIEIFARIKRDIIDKTLALPTNPSLTNKEIQTLISIFVNYLV